MDYQLAALIVTIIIAITSIGISIYQSGQSKIAAAAADSARANVSELMIKIIDRIDMKLDDYVRRQSFLEYTEGHAKEHMRIEQELTRLRDWKEGKS